MFTSNYCLIVGGVTNEASPPQRLVAADQQAQ